MVTEKLLTVDDTVEWQTVLPVSASVFGSVEYARICQERSGYEARLFVLESDSLLVAYPFFLRPINSLPFAPDMPEALWDTLTPEYTGPVECKSFEPSAGSDFADRWSKYCREQRIVAEFAHLHPWNGRAEFFEPSWVEFNREIVYVDLTLSEERLWHDSFTPTCRKNIRRALRENVKVFRATSPEHIQQFHRIYVQTMDRVCALDRYYFPLSYFMAFFEQMPDNATFFLAEYKGQVVAATLALHEDIHVYAYLGGADHDFKHVRPTNAVIYEAIRWAQRQGKKRLILGGGYEPNDGISHFKASFSPLRARFHVHKRIHLPEEYAALCRAWSAYYHCDVSPSGYFPVYRRRLQCSAEYDEGACAET
jgi:serine/alanine adding enzyme